MQQSPASCSKEDYRGFAARLAASSPAQLQLAPPVDLESAYIDTTCLVANIHYPVDWVLLRDATRTLMQAAILIRQRGLKHRPDGSARDLHHPHQ